jgi:DNA-binding MarR family transcriptional regulator
MRKFQFQDDLYEAPGHLIRRLQQAAVSIFMNELADSGEDLTPVQFGALAMTRSRPGVDQATLAGLIAYHKQTIGEVVSTLVRKGLLVRVVSPSDRRSRQLYVTDLGEAALDRLVPKVQSVQDKILEALDEGEQDQFMELLKKITERLNDRSRAPLRRLS